MTDPRTIKSKTSLLIGLPSEIQGLISDCLNHYDLNRLCRTCTTIKGVVIPKLYKTVFIRAPQRWSRLPSLECLLVSTGDGLKHTTELFIQTQQDPLRVSQQGYGDSWSPVKVRAQTKAQFYLPQSSASDSLNALVRLLIVKLPQDWLDGFHWEHCCELDILTLNLLFERQKLSLQVLFCNRYSSPCDNSGSVAGGLRSLSVESMDYEHGGCRWATKMIARNAEKLRHLSLGFTTCIAHDFAHSQSPRHDMMSTSFAVDLRDTLSESDLEPLINLSLESLSLCGLDLGGVIWGETALYVNFNNITQLRLESCSGLSQAFSLFNVQIGFSKLALGALQDLFLRIEDPDPNLTTSLETFLTAVRGLTSLKVLIDKVAAVQDLEPILKVHGKTLRTLVWDERHGSRKRFDVCTSPMSPKLGHLSVVSRNCPSLKLLGIPLDWDTISSSDEKVHEEVGKYLKRMPDLEVLNIRNLPPLNARLAISHMDYFVKYLAAMLVDIVSKMRESNLLKTVALGSPLYKDVKVGTHHVAHTPVSDFLRFRVYNVDYNYPSPSGLSTVLSEVAKGAAVSADEAFTYQHLLRDYWLG